MFTLVLAHGRSAAKVAFMQRNVKAFIMRSGHTESHSVCELATGSRIKCNLPLSLLSRKFLTFPIFHKLTVDLVSGGQRDGRPGWQEEPTQQFRMDDRVASDPEMSSVPRVIWGSGGGFTIPCLVFNTLAFLFFPSLLPSIFFFHPCHTAAPVNSPSSGFTSRLL